MHEKLIEYIDQINFQFREPATSIFATLPAVVNDINNQQTERAVDSLQKVYRDSYKILRGINNMSIAAKLLGDHNFECELIDFSELVKNLFENSKRILPADVKTELDIAPNCFVKGNSMLLTMGLLNILLNSVEYKQEGEARVYLSLKREQDRCVLVYKDNSLGMKPHIAQQAFNAFFTSDPYADMEPSNNMGVGLFIAEQAVKNAGGTILLQTEFSQGVNYIISIPDRTSDSGDVLKSTPADMLLNKYSEVFIQLSKYCNLPDLK